MPPLLVNLLVFGFMAYWLCSWLEAVNLNSGEYTDKDLLSCLLDMGIECSCHTQVVLGRVDDPNACQFYEMEYRNL